MGSVLWLRGFENHLKSSCSLSLRFAGFEVGSISCSGAQTPFRTGTKEGRAWRAEEIGQIEPSFEASQVLFQFNI